MPVPTIRTPHGTRKLGRIRPKARPQCLRFGKYVNFRKAAAALPDTLDYGAKAAASIARMYLNDAYGDCVIAGKAHELGVWSGNELGASNVVLATDKEIYSQYQSICGPGDNGCNITDVLDVMKSKGFIAGGKAYKIDGYVSVDWTNKTEVMTALYLFGALTLGINLPEAWTEGDDGSTWDVTDTGIVGGHDVTAFGYDANGVWIATWGGKRLITWAAFTSQRWLEECYAQLAPLWYQNAKLAPCGVDAATLLDDLDAIGGGAIPPISPPPVPPAPVPPAPVLKATTNADGSITVSVAKTGKFAVDWGSLVTDVMKLVGDGKPVLLNALTTVEQLIADVTAKNWAAVLSTDIESLVALAPQVAPIVADIKAIIADLQATPPAPVVPPAPAPASGRLRSCCDRPLFVLRAKIEVARGLASDGPALTPEQLVAAAQLVTGPFIAKCAASVAGASDALAALDARISATPAAGVWDEIVAFFQSPLGQAILTAIESAVLAILLGA